VVSGGRSDLSVPRLRLSADSSPTRSSPPLNPLRFSASEPLRPPLLLIRFAQIGVAPFRATCQRLAPPPRPLRRPAPSLRRSGARPFRWRSSPADCPLVRSSWSLARLGRLTFALRTCFRSLLRGSCLRLVPRLRQNPLRRSLPQTLRAAGSPPPPTFAPFPAPASPAARSRSAWVPTLRRLRISPLAPLSPDVLRRLRFSGTLAASGTARRQLRATPGYCLRLVPRLRQNPLRAHSAPPARPAQARLLFRLRATCPSAPAVIRPLRFAPRPSSGVRSLGRLPFRLDSGSASLRANCFRSALPPLPSLPLRPPTAGPAPVRSGRAPLLQIALQCAFRYAASLRSAACVPPLLNPPPQAPSD
jgi:hypothetical protein